MKIKTTLGKIIWIFVSAIICIMLIFGGGMAFYAKIHDDVMQDYKLYNCIFNLAQSQNFPEYNGSIQYIEETCIVYRGIDYDPTRFNELGISYGE